MQQRIGIVFLVVGLSIGSYLAGVASGSRAVTPTRSDVAKVSSEFAAFAASVYRPACATHKGLRDVNLARDAKGSIAAFPATATCTDRAKVRVQGVSWAPTK